MDKYNQILQSSSTHPDGSPDIHSLTPVAHCRQLSQLSWNNNNNNNNNYNNNNNTNPLPGLFVNMYISSVFTCQETSGRLETQETVSEILDYRIYE